MPTFVTGLEPLLKLARSTEDALTGIAYADDSQTARLVASKRYPLIHEVPGCKVTIHALP